MAPRLSAARRCCKDGPHIQPGALLSSCRRTGRALLRLQEWTWCYRDGAYIQWDWAQSTGQGPWNTCMQPHAASRSRMQLRMRDGQRCCSCLGDEPTPSPRRRQAGPRPFPAGAEWTALSLRGCRFFLLRRSFSLKRAGAASGAMAGRGETGCRGRGLSRSPAVAVAGVWMAKLEFAGFRSLAAISLERSWPPLTTRTTRHYCVA
jgi:hypothetical protein